MIEATQFRKEKALIEKQLEDSSISQNPKELSRLGKRLQQVNAILECAKKIDSLSRDITLAEQLMTSADKDERELAESEMPELTASIEKMRETYSLLTIPRDPLDDHDAIVEIRAGAGGDEAGLFAAELSRMYTRFSESQNLRAHMVSSNRTGIGGYKEVILEIYGLGAYGLLRWESGVHRVQRVPETEKNGRVHTSTVTVAVLPIIEEKEIEIKPEDVKIEATTSSGHGGQSVNTTYSAIRLVHIATGITVSCQDERSQKQNREKAFQVLRSRLFAQKEEERRKKDSSLRKDQIGSGDRSEKIRTYNFPQDRMTDHRIKQNFHNISTLLEGNLMPVIEAVQKVLAEKRESSEKSKT